MNLPIRKNMRLVGFDYSTAGAYFITICVRDKRPILSHIVGANHDSPVNELTQPGETVKRVIERLPARFGIEIPKYVIMPNHIHLIIVINERAIHESPLQGKRSIISKAIGFLKMNASKEIKNDFGMENIWQRSFYDHVIRGDSDYEEIWNYVENNPLRWQTDEFFVK